MAKRQKYHVELNLKRRSVGCSEYPNCKYNIYCLHAFYILVQLTVMIQNTLHDTFLKIVLFLVWKLLPLDLELRSNVSFTVKKIVPFGHHERKSTLSEK